MTLEAMKIYSNCMKVGGRVGVGPEGDDVKAGFSKMNGSLYWIGMHILYKGCRTLQEGQ